MIALDEARDEVTADVLVVGAGPAGIACAVRASERGAQVVMVDRATEPGGQIWRRRSGMALHGTARRWLDAVLRTNTTFMGATSVIDATAVTGAHEVIADNAGRRVRILASHVVIATGAREMFIPFEGWTLPGVIGIGGAQALLKSGGSFRDRRVVIAGTGPLMFPVACAMRDAGAKLILVAEQARRADVARFAAGLLRSPKTLGAALAYRARIAGTPFATSTWASAAHGEHSLEFVSITDGRRTRHIDADILCTGYGLVPNVELASLLGCKVHDGAVVVDEFQRTSRSGVSAAGETTGVGGSDFAIVEGEIAGYSVTDGLAPHALRSRRASYAGAAARMRRAFAPRDELRSLTAASTIVCRCEDVQYRALAGLGSAPQARLYTRVGMGPCQGRTCMTSLEFLLGWQFDSVRPPLEPTLAGNLVQHGATVVPSAIT